MATFVIVGASLAGAKAAETLRNEGFDGDVVLIGAEMERPYERPPLSKGLLLGTEERDSVFVHDEKWYASAGVDLRLGVRATRIDRSGKAVELDSGGRQPYDRLLLATGATPRRLDLPGAGRARTLRTLADSDGLKAAFADGGHVVIAGAGWIGLETAAAAREAGCEVVIVEPEPAPLHAVLGARVAEVFADLHRRHGVDLRMGETIREVRPDSVIIESGDEIPADMVIFAVGVTPNTELAEGLRVDNGIRTDRALRTSDPDIFAAGDVAFVEGFGRVEHWDNAIRSGEAAARSMLGQSVRYDPVPYFFTDQFELGMEFSGDASGHDDVVIRGSVDDLEFIVYWTREGRVIAGMNVGIWDVAEDIQELIRTAAPPPDGS